MKKFSYKIPLVPSPDISRTELANTAKPFARLVLSNHRPAYVEKRERVVKKQYDRYPPRFPFSSLHYCISLSDIPIDITELISRHSDNFSLISITGLDETVEVVLSEDDMDHEDYFAHPHIEIIFYEIQPTSFLTLSAYLISCEEALEILKASLRNHPLGELPKDYNAAFSHVMSFCREQTCTVFQGDWHDIIYLEKYVPWDTLMKDYEKTFLKWGIPIS